jgi:hypothetical protein
MLRVLEDVPVRGGRLAHRLGVRGEDARLRQHELGRGVVRAHLSAPAGIERVAHFVDRGREVAARAGAEREPFELGEDFAVVASAPPCREERVARGVEGTLQIAQPVAEHVREPALQRHALIGSAGQVEQHLRERGNSLELARPPVQLDELGRRLLVARVEIAQRREEGDGCHVVAHSAGDVGGLAKVLGGTRDRSGLAVEQSELLQAHDLSARVGCFADAALQHRSHEVDVSDRHRHALDEIEIGERELAVSEELARMERRAVGLAVSRRDLCELSARPPRVFEGGRVREMSLEDLAEIVPALGLRVELDQRVVRDLVGRIVLERALVRADGSVWILQLRPLDCPDAVEQLLAPRRVRAALERGAVEGDALLGVALLLQQIVDAREELGRVWLVRERPSERHQSAVDVTCRGVLLADALREEEHLRRHDRVLAEPLGEERSPPLRVGIAGKEIETTEPRADRFVALDCLREAARHQIERLLAGDRDGDVRRFFEGGQPVLHDG